MKSKKTNAIIHSVGLNNNLPDRIVNDIVTSAFEMCKETMQSGDRQNAEFENIQLLNFAKLYVPEGRKQFLKNLNKKNESIRTKELRDTNTT